ncbi:MAG: hypothetical protein BGO78_13745 [Chloroflexi bacterium 44-23]|nr:MAG: hypothetical protein BGO78_13745 [Chloroflexi bacterium 44-23]
MAEQLKNHLLNLSAIIFLVMLAACSGQVTPTFPPTSTLKPSPHPPMSSQTSTAPSQTRTTFKTLTPTFTATPSHTATFDQPPGCLQPPEDYSRIEINGMQINQRTFSMLQNAQALYGGELELTGYHLTQGSYNNSVSASFGTHAGGGAVDLSVIQYGVYQVLYDDIPVLIKALRIAGFAAWLRDFDQLYPGSPIHIHAIAIGDAELSQAAQDQLTGPYGYFRGFNGLPQAEGFAPIPDEHGGPILCQWMLAEGYDLLGEQ